MTVTDDSLLLQRLLAGEQQAYKELVSAYQSPMRAVAYAIVGSRHVDEVVQDAWLSVVRNLGGFQGRSSLKTWLLTIHRQRRQGALQAEPSGGVARRSAVTPHGTLGDDRFAADGHWLLAPFAWHQDTPEALLTMEELRDCLDAHIAQPVGTARQRAEPAGTPGAGAGRNL